MNKSLKLPKLIIIITMIYLLAPLLVTFIYSFATKWESSILPQNLTFNWFSELFQDPRFSAALGRSAFVCTVSVLMSLIVVLTTIFTILYYFPNARKIMRFISIIPFAVPGVILVAGLIRAYASIAPSVTGKIGILIGAYCILILPFMYQSIDNSMQILNVKQLTSAAEMLGASKIRAFLKVVFPNILPGVVSSILLSLSVLLGEFVIVNFSLGTQFETIQVYLYNRLKESGHIASAVTITYFFAEMILLGLILFISNHLYGRKKI